MLDELTRSLGILPDLVSPFTIACAVVAALGALAAFLGLTSVKRVMLGAEFERVSGARAPGMLDRFQARLRQAGLSVSAVEFLLVGLGIGAGLAAVCLLLGFAGVGLLMLPASPWIYYTILMRERDARQRAFREALPDAIDDCADLLAVKPDLPGALLHLAEKGPEAVRGPFQQARSLVNAGSYLGDALRRVADSRPEIFFRHFMIVLADYHSKGIANVREVLHRIAESQRAQMQLQRQAHAAQAGGRIVANIYGVAPAGFLLFMRMFGGATYAEFYSTPIGWIVQLGVVLSGVLTWAIARKIANRGMYLDDVGVARLPKDAYDSTLEAANAKAVDVGKQRTGINVLNVVQSRFKPKQESLTFDPSSAAKPRSAGAEPAPPNPLPGPTKPPASAPMWSVEE